jgi:hypothetical protein
VLGFLELLERPYSILTDAVYADSSVGSGAASEEGSKADVISRGSCRRSRSLIAKGLHNDCISALYSSTSGAVPGGVQVLSRPRRHSLPQAWTLLGLDTP